MTVERHTREELTDFEVWGIIPDFYSLKDERGLVEQIDENYQHGGGWSDFTGFRLDFDESDPMRSTLTYYGDPAYRCNGWFKFRHETAMIFQSSWFVVRQPSGSWRVARID